MTIPTQMSLQGFIATGPELTFTGKGHARFVTGQVLKIVRLGG